MRQKPLYISAPSRSGSSLLVRMLNCTSNMVIVNEPINSVNIVDKTNIKAIFNTIKNDLEDGFIMQRVDVNGREATDTFPPSKMRWGRINHPFDGVEVVGIKKSFPAFSNEDFFKPFIREWPVFVEWMNKTMNGCVVAILRNPRLTILSWKTTFEALKESTENQCLAWNLIANTILSSQDLGVRIIRYEDLVQNPTPAVETVADLLGVEVRFKENLPNIKQFSLEDYLRNKGISADSAEIEFRLIERLCGETAEKLGYSTMCELSSLQPTKGELS